MRPARPGAGVLVALLLAAGGCGYSFQGTLPPHIASIAVPVFANRTPEPAVETILTRAVVDAFSTSGRLRVTTPERADSILNGEVTGYDIQSIAFDPRANVRQYRLVVTMNLRYRDLRENRLVFERLGLQEQAEFRVSAAVAETIVREETALRAAAQEIARAVVALTLERF
jgi:hypothetical protein